MINTSIHQKDIRILILCCLKYNLELFKARADRSIRSKSNLHTRRFKDILLCPKCVFSPGSPMRKPDSYYFLEAWRDDLKITSTTNHAKSIKKPTKPLDKDFKRKVYQ